MSDRTHSLALLQGLRDELDVLTDETHGYLTCKTGGRRAGLSPAEVLAAGGELQRLLTRIAEITAWILVRRAVHAGELSRGEARTAPYRLSFQDICTQTEPASAERLDPRLRDLLNKSERLYRRILYLDDQQDRPGDGFNVLSKPT